MKLDILDGLNDSELQDVIGRSQELLKQRDADRKAKALSDARALLASVGLTLKDLSGKARAQAARGPVYHGGRRYQHPTNKALVWNANGQKPTWLRELERAGGKPVEIAESVASDNAPALRKTG